ncbi:MAG: T9SS type A sorting domain-containing protein [Rhodothermales bacterium]|nr:T9SS type A sorting domain-containing protein [Rhodothermales bacterium]
MAEASDGYRVVSIEAGEWLEYSLGVADTGRYILRTFVSSESGGGLFYFAAGAERTRRISVPSTPAGQTTAVEAELDLVAGPSILRLLFLTGGDYAIDRIELTAASATGLDVVPDTHAPVAYPNPAAGELVLRLGQVGPRTSVTVFDPAGRRVLSASVSSGENRLSVGSLAPGAYMIRIDGDDTPATSLSVIVL